MLIMYNPGYASTIFKKNTCLLLLCVLTNTESSHEKCLKIKIRFDRIRLYKTSFNPDEHVTMWRNL